MDNELNFCTRHISTRFILNHLFDWFWQFLVSKMYMDSVQQQGMQTAVFRILSLFFVQASALPQMRINSTWNPDRFRSRLLDLSWCTGCMGEPPTTGNEYCNIQSFIMQLRRHSILKPAIDPYNGGPSPKRFPFAKAQWCVHEVVIK